MILNIDRFDVTVTNMTTTVCKVNSTSFMAARQIVLSALWCFFVFNLSLGFKDCDLVLRKNADTHSVGVFANRHFNRGEVLERCIAVVIPPSQSSYSPVLDEYIYGHSNNSIAIVLGYGMLYNHSFNETIDVTWFHHMSVRTAADSSNVFDYTITALREIQMGDEIFTSYGDEQWFIDRHISFARLDAPNNGLEALYEHIPGCVQSKTEVFQGRVFATQYILEGEVVEVTRALLLPVSTGDGNELQRYLWYSNGGSLNKTLLMSGHGALYQASDLSVATLSYKWYMDDDSDVFQCDDKLLVQFIATRLIQPNMELTVPLVASGSRRYVHDDMFQVQCF